MLLKELVMRVVMLFLGIVFVIESLRLGLGNLNQPKSGFLPFFTALAFILVGVFSLLKTYAIKKRGEFEDAAGQSTTRFRNVALVVILLFIYVASLPWLGYLIGTFLMLTLLFKIGGMRTLRLTLFSSLVATSLSYLIFDLCLSLRFPKGILGF